MGRFSLLLIFLTGSGLGLPATAFASPFAAPSSLALGQNVAVNHKQSKYLKSSPRSMRRSDDSRLHMALSFPRGGAALVKESGAVSSVLSKLSQCNKDPQVLFNTTLFALAVLIAFAKILPRLAGSNADDSAMQAEKPASIKALQRRFLAVFWLLRCSDWLQGPYFYEVYASKVINGAQASMSLVSNLFLTGFASTAIFGPSIGRAADTYGRKKATLAFTVLYALGALSTKSVTLQVLFLGRILSGIGTSLLFSAPESWLVGEAQRSGDDPDGKYLGETFGLAYAGDSLVAISAGQLAAAAATARGPTGPFELSTVFLMMGGLLAAFLWKENVAEMKNDEKPSIKDAIEVIKADPKIMLVGGVQSLFEAAMYIFVLQWPPAVSGAIAKYFKDATAATPYGTVFSCFMASCLLGSTIFGTLAKQGVPTETSAAGMLTVATLAMSAATLTVSTTMSLPAIVASFFAFEACVGMYFPSIGTLRSKYVPDSHRSVIMNLFGIPLNVLVVSVFLSIKWLGVNGALSVSSGALGVATLCMFTLRRMIAKEVKEAPIPVIA
jgi:MFS family permease